MAKKERRPRLQRGLCARAGGIKDEGNKSRNDTFAISNQTVYVRTTKRQKGDYQKVIKIIAVK